MEGRCRIRVVKLNGNKEVSKISKSLFWKFIILYTDHNHHDSRTVWTNPLHGESLSPSDVRGFGGRVGLSSRNDRPSGRCSWKKEIRITRIDVLYRVKGQKKDSSNIFSLCDYKHLNEMFGIQNDVWATNWNLFDTPETHTVPCEIVSRWRTKSLPSITTWSGSSLVKCLQILTFYWITKLKCCYMSDYICLLNF